MGRVLGYHSYEVADLVSGEARQYFSHAFVQRGAMIIHTVVESFDSRMRIAP